MVTIPLNYHWNTINSHITFLFLSWQFYLYRHTVAQSTKCLRIFVILISRVQTSYNIMYNKIEISKTLVELKLTNWIVEFKNTCQFMIKCNRYNFTVHTFLLSRTHIVCITFLEQITTLQTQGYSSESVFVFYINILFTNNKSLLSSLNCVKVWWNVYVIVSRTGSK